MNNILCVIRARGGSKRIPKKRYKRVRGKPLIAYRLLRKVRPKEEELIPLRWDFKKIYWVQRVNQGIWNLERRRKNFLKGPPEKRILAQNRQSFTWGKGPRKGFPKFEGEKPFGALKGTFPSFGIWISI